MCEVAESARKGLRQRSSERINIVGAAPGLGYVEFLDCVRVRERQIGVDVGVVIIRTVQLIAHPVCAGPRSLWHIARLERPRPRSLLRSNWQ
jgi:hypothetical protein